MANYLMPAHRATAFNRYFPSYKHALRNQFSLNVVTRIPLLINVPRKYLLFKATRFNQPSVEDLNRKRIKRKKYSYETNTTIARKLEFTLSESLNAGKEKNLIMSLEKPEIRDCTGDHIYRRVLLFYYQAVVYYRTGCVIEKGRTILQHGKGRFAWSSAAHSAILPDLKDDFFKNLRGLLIQQGLNDLICKILIALGVSEEKLTKRPNGQTLTEAHVDELLEGVETEGLLSSKSRFYNNLNSTVELPHYINEYDCIIEDCMRNKSLGILNQVSRGELQPYEALDEFVKELQSVLNKSEAATQRKLRLLDKIQTFEEKIWNMEQNFSYKIFPKYLQTIQKIGRCYRKLQEDRKVSFRLVIKGRLTWQKDYFSEGVKINERNYRRINSLIARNPRWTPMPMDAWTDQLNRTLKIIELQKKYTVLPQKELLSGRLVGNTLVPLNNAELFSQTLSLIRRE
jgi:hypothetical protein